MKISDKKNDIASLASQFRFLLVFRTFLKMATCSQDLRGTFRFFARYLQLFFSSYCISKLKNGIAIDFYDFAGNFIKSFKILKVGHIFCYALRLLLFRHSVFQIQLYSLQEPDKSHFSNSRIKKNHIFNFLKKRFQTPRKHFSQAWGHSSISNNISFF